MKIVLNALSAQLGGGQTYLKNLLSHLPCDAAFELLVYAPASLELPTDHRIRRFTTRWPTNNPILRACWERWGLPRFLRRESADVLFCPGGVVAKTCRHRVAARSKAGDLESAFRSGEALHNYF